MERGGAGVCGGGGVTEDGYQKIRTQGVWQGEEEKKIDAQESPLVTLIGEECRNTHKQKQWLVGGYYREVLTRD